MYTSRPLCRLGINLSATICLSPLLPLSLQPRAQRLVLIEVKILAKMDHTHTLSLSLFSLHPLSLGYQRCTVIKS
jgi:hypothetical protein